MTTKKSTFTSEEKFFINLSEQNIFNIDYQDFQFTLEIPSLLEESALSLSAINAAQIILQNPEYQGLLSKLKYPTFEETKQEEGEDDFQLVEKDLDISKLSHVKYAIRNLPDEFTNTVNNIAYLQLVVKKILYKNQKIWIKNKNEELEINDFINFVSYVKVKNLRVGALTDYLLTRYLDWLENIEVSPQEVKN